MCARAGGSGGFASAGLLLTRIEPAACSAAVSRYAVGPPARTPRTRLPGITCKKLIADGVARFGLSGTAQMSYSISMTQNRVASHQACCDAVAKIFIAALVLGCSAPRDTEQATATKSPATDAEYVAIAMPNGPPNSGINGTVCPGALREAHGTRDYTLAHAEVRRSPIQPGDSGHITFAEAEYVPASAKPADPRAADTLRINCLTMRHISTPQPRPTGRARKPESKMRDDRRIGRRA